MHDRDADRVKISWNHGTVDSLRVDRWLWAVRIFRTRSAANDACRGGHVRINGARAKPAAPVRVGDRIAARTRDREREVEVTRLVPTRVGAAIATECFVDHSPEPTPVERMPPVAARGRGAGRPSKRERRQLDRLRGR